MRDGAADALHSQLVWRPALGGWCWEPLAAPHHPARSGAARVRQAMLAEAGTLTGTPAASLVRALRFAPGLAQLCELRGALRDLLAAQRGELQALRAIMQLDALVREACADAPISPAPGLG